LFNGIEMSEGEVVSNSVSAETCVLEVEGLSFPSPTPSTEPDEEVHKDPTRGIFF
jgi:hypothetical protein